MTSGSVRCADSGAEQVFPPASAAEPKCSVFAAGPVSLEGHLGALRVLGQGSFAGKGMTEVYSVVVLSFSPPKESLREKME